MNIYILLIYLIFIIIILGSSKFYKKYYFNPNKITIVIINSNNLNISYLDKTKYQIVILKKNVTEDVNKLNYMGFETHGINIDFSSIRNTKYVINYITYYFGKVNMIINYFDEITEDKYNYINSNIINVSYLVSKLSEKMKENEKVINIYNKVTNNLILENYVENFTKLLSHKFNLICVIGLINNYDKYNENIKKIFYSNNKEYTGRIIGPDSVFHPNLELNIKESHLENEMKKTLSNILKSKYYIPIGENFVGHSPKINNINLNNYNFSIYAKTGEKLKVNISKKYNIPTKCISINNGISNTISFIIRTFVKDNHEIINTLPTWGFFNEITEQFNKVNVKSLLKVKDNSLYVDFDDIFSKITSLTRLIILVSPINKNDFEDFCKKIPSNILIVIDNCYDDFFDNFQKTNPNDILKYKNSVINLYSFSKFHGLGNLGIGFSITSIYLSKILEQSITYHISNIYEDIAITALNDDVHNSLVRNIYSSERKYIIERIKAKNLHYIDPNQIYILIKCDYKEYEKKLNKINISIVKPIPEFPNYILFYIDSHENNKKMLDAI